MDLFTRVNLDGVYHTVKAIKNGLRTITKNITISSTLVPGSKGRWKDKVSYFSLKVRFTSVAFKMGIPMDSVQGNGRMAMCSKASS